MTLNKTHRTAVFVRRSAGSPKDYLERNAALVKSLNRKPDVSEGGTIKVDVYTVIGDTIEIGLVDVNATPAGPSSYLVELATQEGFTVTPVEVETANYSGRLSSPRLRELACEAGYTQTVIVTGEVDC